MLKAPSQGRAPLGSLSNNLPRPGAAKSGGARSSAGNSAVAPVPTACPKSVPPSAPLRSPSERHREARAHGNHGETVAATADRSLLLQLPTTAPEAQSAADGSGGAWGAARKWMGAWVVTSVLYCVFGVPLWMRFARTLWGTKDNLPLLPRARVWLRSQTPVVQSVLLALLMPSTWHISWRTIEWLGSEAGPLSWKSTTGTGAAHVAVGAYKNKFVSYEAALSLTALTFVTNLVAWHVFKDLQKMMCAWGFCTTIFACGNTILHSALELSRQFVLHSFLLAMASVVAAAAFAFPAYAATGSRSFASFFHSFCSLDAGVGAVWGLCFGGVVGVPPQALILPLASWWAEHATAIGAVIGAEMGAIAGAVVFAAERPWFVKIPCFSFIVSGFYVIIISDDISQLWMATFQAWMTTSFYLCTGVGIYKVGKFFCGGRGAK